MTELEELRAQLKTVTAERNHLHAELTDLRLKAIEDRQDDHENRIRAVETISTRSNVLYALATGGGLISIITLIRTLTA